MMQKLTLKLIKPSGVVYEATADMVVMPGSEGEFGVMYGHVPMVVQLKAGDMKVHDGGNIKTMEIGAGVARVDGESVAVICE